MLKFHNISRTVMYVALFFLSFQLSYAYPPCPSYNCPTDSDSLAVEFLFENNVLDTSGNNNDGISSVSGVCPRTYINNIAGRPGYYLNGMIYNNWCSLQFPACTLYRDQGEIEWYQYITNTAAPEMSTVLTWSNMTDIGLGHLFIEGSMDPSTWAGGTSVLIRYSYGIMQFEEYMADCVIEKQWQHFVFQWGSFGTRLVCDGVVVGGSPVIWFQGSRDHLGAYIGTNFNANGDGFTGYIDDFRIRACGSHGTPTYTPTLTITKTCTISKTPTLTSTFTITRTHTITPTFTEVLTDTVTPTSSVTETTTFSPTDTYTPTITLTPTSTVTGTITLTPTLTPVASDFIVPGNFPNPFEDYTKIVVGLPEDCGVVIAVYTVSGEKANSFSFEGKTGMNAFQVGNTNSGGIRLFSGVYIYSVKVLFKNNTERTVWRKFAIF